MGLRFGGLLLLFVSDVYGFVVGVCGFPVLGGCLGFWFVLGVSLDFASRVYGLHGFRFYEGRFVGFDLLCSSVYCFDCYGAGFCRFGGLDCGFCFLGLGLLVLGFLGVDWFSGSGLWAGCGAGC